MFSIVDIFKKYELKKDGQTFKIYLCFAAIMEAEMQPQFNAAEAARLAMLPALTKLNGTSIEDARLSEALLAVIRRQSNEMLASYRSFLYDLLGIAAAPAEGQLYNDAALERIASFEAALAEAEAPLAKGRKSKNTDKIQHLPKLGLYASMVMQQLDGIEHLSTTDRYNITAEVLLAAGVASKYSDFSEDALQANSRADTLRQVKSWLASYRENKAEFDSFQPWQWVTLEEHLKSRQNAKEMRLQAIFQQLDF